MIFPAASENSAKFLCLYQTNKKKTLAKFYFIFPPSVVVRTARKMIWCGERIKMLGNDFCGIEMKPR